MIKDKLKNLDRKITKIIGIRKLRLIRNIIWIILVLTYLYFILKWVGYF